VPERERARQELARLDAEEARDLRRGALHLAQEVPPVTGPDDLWPFVNRVRYLLGGHVLAALGLAGVFGARSEQTRGGRAIVSGDAPAHAAHDDGDADLRSVFERQGASDGELAAVVVRETLRTIPGFELWYAVRLLRFTQEEVAQHYGMAQQTVSDRIKAFLNVARRQLAD
jgi:hypothetical protein